LEQQQQQQQQVHAKVNQIKSSNDNEELAIQLMERIGRDIALYRHFAREKSHVQEWMGNQGEQEEQLMSRLFSSSLEIMERSSTKSSSNESVPSLTLSSQYHPNPSSYDATPSQLR
jgi:hypothetical protein